MISVHPSALKHGIAEEDTLRAAESYLYAQFIHSMKARKQYLELL